MIGKTGKGVITRQDFEDLFENLNIQVSRENMDKFINGFWRDSDAGMDYKSFLRIF